MLNLVEQAKNGDKASFIKLIEQVKDKAYKTAYIQLGNKEDSKDAVQETILKVYERICTLRENTFFQTWFIRILLNECHNIQRDRKKLISLVQKQINSEKTYSINDASIAVEMKDLIDRLGGIYKIVIDLRYNHNLKIDEIAKVLDVPPGTVKSRLNKALKVLRNKVDQKEEIK